MTRLMGSITATKLLIIIMNDETHPLHKHMKPEQVAKYNKYLNSIRIESKSICQNKKVGS